MCIRDRYKIPIKVRACDTMGYGVNFSGAVIPRSVQGIIYAIHTHAGVPHELIEWHGHNDFYKAVTNSTTAWLYGLSLIHIYVTVTKTIGDTTTVDSQTTGNFVGYTNTVYDQNYQRLTGAAVRYIGNQTLEQSSDGQWHASANLITSPEQGVFYNCSNFSTLNVGPNLQGLGNYAFYGCGALKSITLGDNLRVIGNSAFQNCQLLNQVFHI